MQKRLVAQLEGALRIGHMSSQLAEAVNGECAINESQASSAEAGRLHDFNLNCMSCCCRPLLQMQPRLMKWRSWRTLCAQGTCPASWQRQSMGERPWMKARLSTGAWRESARRASIQWGIAMDCLKAEQLILASASSQRIQHG